MTLTKPEKLADPVPQPVDPIENNFENFSEHSLQSKETKKKKKTNGVQFGHRMTKNRHKQNKVPKLPFRKTEPNELVDPISQQVQSVKRDSQNFSKPSSERQESKKTNQVENQLRMT